VEVFSLEALWPANIAILRYFCHVITPPPRPLSSTRTLMIMRMCGIEPPQFHKNIIQKVIGFSYNKQHKKQIQIIKSFSIGLFVVKFG